MKQGNHEKQSIRRQGKYMARNIVCIWQATLRDSHMARLGTNAFGTIKTYVFSSQQNLNLVGKFRKHICALNESISF